MSSNANHTPAAGDHPVDGPQKGSLGPSITLATFDPQARHTPWTINNYTPEDLERARAYPTKLKSVRYHCFAQEVGDSGTPHLQGYTAWTTTMSLETFKRKMGGRLHYETHTGGTAVQNRDYCAGFVEKKGNKLNPTFEEFGELPKQGERTDWTAALDQLRTQRVVEVVDAQPHLLPCIRALERYQTLSRQPPKDRDVRTIYVHGPSGCGKSRSIRQAFPEAYWKPQGDWWDGYEGQAVVVLDDYYGDQPYSQLLRVLDRYPLRLPVKGGFVPAEFTTVVITSNARLDDQYTSITGIKREPLYRRIHCVISADHTISAEDITNGLQAPPVHPQVHHQAIHHPHWPPSDHAPDPEGSTG